MKATPTITPQDCSKVANDADRKSFLVVWLMRGGEQWFGAKKVRSEQLSASNKFAFRYRSRLWQSL
jgi:hypothetical protein